MNRTDQDRARFEEIEAYVLGTMSPARRQRFEEELAGSADLRAELEMHRTSIRAVELGGFDRLLQDLGREAARGEAAPRPGGHWLRYAAAAALLLAVAAWFLLRPTTAERLFAEHFVPDPGLPVAMGATTDHAFHDAMVAYKLGDHAEARTAWTTLLHADPANDTLRYFCASASLALGDAAAAIPDLEQLAGSTSPFATKARWYLLLAYVRTGDRAKALAVPLDQDPVYGERVRAVKRSL